MRTKIWHISTNFSIVPDLTLSLGCSKHLVDILYGVCIKTYSKTPSRTEYVVKNDLIAPHTP